MKEKESNMKEKQERTLYNLKYWFSRFYDANGYHNYSEDIQFKMFDGTEKKLEGYHLYVDGYWLIFDTDPKVGMKIYPDKDIKEVKIVFGDNKTLQISK